MSLFKSLETRADFLGELQSAPGHVRARVSAQHHISIARKRDCTFAISAWLILVCFRSRLPISSMLRVVLGRCCRGSQAVVSGAE